MSHSICLIDTSVFCNVLAIPNKCSDRAEVLKTLEEYIQLGTVLLLPLATVLETGNHIAQQGDGRQRRAAAGRFVAEVTKAVHGTSPFVTTPFVEPDELLEWLVEFPDCATKKIGLAAFPLSRRLSHSVS